MEHMAFGIKGLSGRAWRSWDVGEAEIGFLRNRDAAFHSGIGLFVMCDSQVFDEERRRI